MATDGLVMERRDATLSVTIDHGEGNLFSPAMVIELLSQLRVAGDDPALRFVRLGARGDVFCLGREGARREGPPPTPRSIRNVATSVVALNEVLQTTPLVVIAEVHGDAAGLGAGLVGCADVAVASKDARLSVPEILSGFAPTVVIGWLGRTVPRKRAFEMVTTGAWVTAETALCDGLLTEVVPRDRLAARVDERIAVLAALDATALRDAKTFMSHARAMDPSSAAAASINALAVSIAGGHA